MVVSVIGQAAQVDGDQIMAGVLLVRFPPTVCQSMRYLDDRLRDQIPALFVAIRSAPSPVLTVRVNEDELADMLGFGAPPKVRLEKENFSHAAPRARLNGAFFLSVGSSLTRMDDIQVRERRAIAAELAH